ncbi:DUF1302 domain-containing protein [Pseudomonas typographi]|uniref:DUF1302 domain-containing protein n=1 Tax=Pseudomonas typographi TaxID=2715964 RepID=UPI00168554E8|nr:DUF1302 family protein [Pseudomonas typographi]MBD1552584.1 DUF1302 domain-containing protein [Pseudomonas typographi]
MPSPTPPRVRLALSVAAALASGQLHAKEFQLDNPDLNIRWDNTVRYNLGVRAEGREHALANNATYDESDSKFKRGDVVTNRVDLMSEFELAYKQYQGFRVSGAGWYDQAYADTDVETNNGNVYYSGVGAGASTSSYDNGHYSGFTRRYHRGLSGELLDAFAFTRFDVGDVPVSLRAGRHTVYWGNGLLIAGHAISYSQAPLDGRKAVSNPGTETREIFLPLTQLSAQAQVTDRLSLAAQYFLEWDNTRAPEGGTYLASADVALEGPDRLPVYTGVTRPIGDPLRPHNRGNWGVMGTYSLDFLHSDIGLYYREYDDYNPWGLQVGADSARYVYARNTQLYGLSWSIGPMLGGGSLGADLSYRKNAALVSSNISTVDDQGARGDTVHLVVNGLWLLPQTKFFDTGNFIAELAYSHLQRVTKHAELFKGEGYAGCPAGQDKAWGCATRNYVGVAFSFAPQWLGVFPGWNISAPMSLDYGLSGNAANGGGNEGKYSYKVGIKGTFDERYEVTLAYIGYGSQRKYDDIPGIGKTVVGGNGDIGLSDRNWLSLTLSTAF